MRIGATQRRPKEVGCEGEREEEEEEEEESSKGSTHPPTHPSKQAPSPPSSPVPRPTSNLAKKAPSFVLPTTTLLAVLPLAWPTPRNALNKVDKPTHPPTHLFHPNKQSINQPLRPTHPPTHPGLLEGVRRVYSKEAKAAWTAVGPSIPLAEATGMNER